MQMIQKSTLSENSVDADRDVELNESNEYDEDLDIADTGMEIWEWY